MLLLPSEPPASAGTPPGAATPSEPARPSLETLDGAEVYDEDVIRPLDRPIYAEGALAVLQPDICHAGGITECRKIAAMGEAAFAKVALHCPLSPLALAASLQLDAALPNFLVQEHNEVLDYRQDGRTLFGKGYFKQPLVLEDDGCVALPTGPGLGIELDLAEVEKAHQLYLRHGLGARDDAVAMRYLVPNWTFDPKRPCMVR